MTDWFILFGKLFLVIVLSLLGMLCVRKSVRISTLESHNDVAGFVYAVLGVIYAVLQAFVVYVVFIQFQTAQDKIEKEANALGDLYRVSSNLQEPARNEILMILKDYARTMIEKDFPEMRKGNFHGETKLQHDKLWNIFYQYKPKDDLDKIWFEKALSICINFADAKRARVDSAKQCLPDFMWFVLNVGGFITIVYSYFFFFFNVWAQGLMVVFLAGTVTLVLLLIEALEHPFAGVIQVSSEPFEMFLKYFNL
ncbi:MAG: DUF4239 domain-containing protein [Deltaproteobacteria bacterium]|nr:DUF4239 domain-containing protein [Deltaproteobacteria bacterium]